MAVEVRPQSPQTPVKLGWETALGSPDRCTCAKAGVPKSSAAEPIKENAAKANVQAHRPAITPIASVPGVIWSEFQPRFRPNWVWIARIEGNACHAHDARRNDIWMRASWDEANALQRSLPDGALRVLTAEVVR